MPSASPRPLRECFLAALAYLITTFVCVWLLKHPLADGSLWLRAAVAVLPTVPIGYAVRAFVHLVLAGDEMQRRIDLEAIAIAGLVVGLGTLTLSLLLVAEVIAVTAREALIWVFPALWLIYALARTWAARRYR